MLDSISSLELFQEIRIRYLTPCSQGRRIMKSRRNFFGGGGMVSWMLDSRKALGILVCNVNLFVLSINIIWYQIHKLCCLFRYLAVRTLYSIAQMAHGALVSNSVHPPCICIRGLWLVSSTNVQKAGGAQTRKSGQLESGVCRKYPGHLIMVMRPKIRPAPNNRRIREEVALSGR